MILLMFASLVAAILNLKKENLYMKNILITGASRGIGRSIALKFASEGYRVFLNCHASLSELEDVRHIIEEDYHATCRIVTGDVGNPDDVARMFEQIYRSCGRLDVLINNAGISHIGLLMDMTQQPASTHPRTPSPTNRRRALSRSLPLPAELSIPR